MTANSPAAGSAEFPTREDVQELREAIESLRDHVQIVWQTIDEVREVIDQALGPDLPDLWTVEPSQGFGLGRYRPFAGYNPFDEWTEEQAAVVETPPVLQTCASDGADDGELPEEVFQEVRTAVAARLRESQRQGGMDSPAEPLRHNGQEDVASPAIVGATQQRSLWHAVADAEPEAAASPAIGTPEAAPAKGTPQKEAEPGASWFVRPDRQCDFGGRPHDQWPPADEDRDSICVDRVHAGRTDRAMYRFTIRLGDTIEVVFPNGRKETGKVVGIIHSSSEVRVQFNGHGEGVWFYKGNIYPATEPDKQQPKENTFSPHRNPPLVDQLYTLDDWILFRHDFSDGQVDAAGIHAEFSRMKAGKEHFIEQLVKSKSADQLRLMAMQHGHYDARRNTKSQNAESVYRSCLTAFTLGEKSVCYQPMQESYDEALERIVMAMTDESIAKQREESRQEREAREKALTNPETYAELSQFVGRKGTDQLSYEQLATWDQLNADISRNGRKQRHKDTVEQFQSPEIESVEFRIIEGFHDCEQVPLWIVQLTSRVERATFQELKIKANQLGGWWSSFKKQSAGFQFRSQESAEKFAGLASGDADRSEELLARKLRKMDNASERLTAVADSLDEKAAEFLAADDAKLKNTARRADMAASMRAQAYSDQADAKTLRSIAAALAAGEATYLDGVWNSAQVRTLEAILREARRERINKRLTGEGVDRRTHGWSQRYDRMEAVPLTAADARYATSPKPYLYTGHLTHAFAQLAGKPGVKQATAKMRKLVDSRPKDQEYVEFVNDYQVELLEDFLVRARAAGCKVWWFDHCLDNYKRVKSANIHDGHELRMALRELVPHLATAAGDDPVTRAGDDLRGRDLVGFYPTPRPLIEQMLDAAAIEPTHRVLEPSCGKADIVDAIRRRWPEADIVTIEQNLTLQGVLTAKGYGEIVIYGDFLEHCGQYDRVLMNPPFAQGQDVEHIRHAYDLLADGGRVVAIAGEHAFFANDARSVEFREWLDELAAEVEELPDDAFKGIEAFRRTGVRTRLVVVDKP